MHITEFCGEFTVKVSRYVSNRDGIEKVWYLHYVRYQIGIYKNHLLSLLSPPQQGKLSLLGFAPWYRLFVLFSGRKNIYWVRVRSALRMAYPLINNYILLSSSHHVCISITAFMLNPWGGHFGRLASFFF